MTKIKYKLMNRVYSRTSAGRHLNVIRKVPGEMEDHGSRKTRGRAAKRELREGRLLLWERQSINEIKMYY